MASDPVEDTKAATPDPDGAGQQGDWSAEHLGSVVRSIRTRRGMRLKDLAEASGLSASFLSQVEQGQSDISVGRLIRLAQALNVHMTDLVELPPPPDRPLVRANERIEVPSPTDGLSIELLAASLSESHTYSLATLAKGTVAAALNYRIPGMETFLFIIEGAGTIDFTTGDSVELAAGDSITYLSHHYRAMTNTHNGDTSLIWVSFPARP